MKSGLKNVLASIPAAALLCGAVGSAFAMSGEGAPLKAQPVPARALETPDACAKLVGLNLNGVKIISARSQVADAPVEGVTFFDVTGKSPEGVPIAGLPAFCRVVGSIQSEPGSDIGFEVWMPSAPGWNGRLHGVGIGGFAGYIDYLNLGLAVKAGQVGVATDTGHKLGGDGSTDDSSWAKGHPERVRDYGWQAIHLSTVAAKQLAQSLYGRGPDKSYFVGCSGGGRQGLIEASRFPEDYDGILSGAPAANFTDLAIAMINPIQAQRAPGAAIRPEQAKLIQDEVIKQCDALDGLSDGLIEDPRQCKLDVKKLACGTSRSPLCLSPAQTTALRRIYAGPRDARGRQLTGAYPPAGAEASTSWLGIGWDHYIFSAPAKKSGGAVLASGILGDLVQEPFATPATFDFNKDPARLKAALSKDTDASPDLQRFFARGGKLILWHGWADAAIPPDATLAYHDAMLRQAGPKAKESSRLYMVPGVQHCAGGAGPDSFGQANAPQSGDTPENSMVAALQEWVEKDKRPAAIVGHMGTNGIYGVPRVTPERQRLLCAWPGKAVLRPGSDPDKASSYSCTGSAAPFRGLGRH